MGVQIADLFTLETGVVLQDFEITIRAKYTIEKVGGIYTIFSLLYYHKHVALAPVHQAHFQEVIPEAQINDVYNWIYTTISGRWVSVINT
jgi:hypothetical protein